MSLMFNPGSNVPDEVPNRFETAKERAEEWHASMVLRWPEVTMSCPDPGDCSGGRWTFTFYHPVTGVTRELWVHGVDRDDEGPFGLRVYWHGSSCSNPQDGSWLPHYGDKQVDYLKRIPLHDSGSNCIESGSTHCDDVTWRAVTTFVPVCVCDRVGDSLFSACPHHPEGTAS